MGSEAWLLWGVVFGSVGLAYFVYGKKQHRFVPLLCELHSWRSLTLYRIQFFSSLLGWCFLQFRIFFSR